MSVLKYLITIIILINTNVSYAKRTTGVLRLVGVVKPKLDVSITDLSTDSINVSLNYDLNNKKLKLERNGFSSTKPYILAVDSSDVSPLKVRFINHKQFHSVNVSAL